MRASLISNVNEDSAGSPWCFSFKFLFHSPAGIVGLYGTC